MVDNTAVVEVPSVDSKLTKPGRVDIGIAFKMRFMNGMDFQTIGNHFGVSPQAVEQALRPFKSEISDQATLSAFNHNHNHILQALDLKHTMALFDEDAIAKASLNNRAYAWTQIRNQRLLAEGKATANIAYKSVDKEVNRLNEQLMSLIKDNKELEGMDLDGNE